MLDNYYTLNMTRAQYFKSLKQRNAIQRKNKLDTAFEIYSALTEEQHCTMNISEFCDMLQSRMQLPNWRAAYAVCKNMQLEYHVEFANTSRTTSRGFTGHKHTAESRQKMSIRTSINQKGKRRGPYRKTVEKMMTNDRICHFDRINNNMSSQIVV